MNKEILNLFIKIWDNRFPQDDQLEMFHFFSMREFQRIVVDIRTAEESGEEYSEKLADFYCEEKIFTPKKRSLLQSTKKQKVSHSLPYHLVKEMNLIANV